MRPKAGALVLPGRSKNRLVIGYYTIEVRCRLAIRAEEFGPEADLLIERVGKETCGKFQQMRKREGALREQ